MRDGRLWSGHYVNSNIDKRFDPEKSERLFLVQDQVWVKRWASKENPSFSIGVELFKADLRFWTSAHNVQDSLDSERREREQVARVVMLSPPEWTIEAEESRTQMVSAFDVDGPCLVFTPYDSALERVPRQLDCVEVERVAIASFPFGSRQASIISYWVPDWTCRDDAGVIRTTAVKGWFAGGASFLNLIIGKI